MSISYKVLAGKPVDSIWEAKAGGKYQNRSYKNKILVCGLGLTGSGWCPVGGGGSSKRLKKEERF
jgi:hypothetical protein